jgi:hypothetical protein
MRELGLVGGAALRAMKIIELLSCIYRDRVRVDGDRWVSRRTLK